MAAAVSVIVPAYQSQSYLARCLDSVIGQTFQNWEVCLVDDGSSDSTPRICDAYGQKDARIHVIHQNNAGLSAARNAGLDYARGDFYAFLDSDDYLEPDMLEQMISALTVSGADLAFCGHFVQWENGKQHVVAHRSRTMNRQEFCEFLSSGKGNDFVCNKIYTKALWNGLRFPVGKYFEDIPTNTRLLPRIQKVSYVGAPLYHYVQHDTGITRSKPGVRLMDGIAAKQERVQVIRQLEPELADLAQRQLVYFLLWTEYLISGQDCEEALLNKQPEILEMLSRPYRNLGFSLSLARWIRLHLPGLFTLAARMIPRS